MKPRLRSTTARVGWLLIVLAAGPAAAGCGPSFPQRAEIQAVPGTIAYGGRPPSPSPAPPPPPLSGYLPGFPAIFQAPPAPPLLLGGGPGPAPTPTRLVTACPAPDPLAAPDRAVTAEDTGYPAAATYAFRAVGSQTSGGTTTGLDPNTSRQVIPGAPTVLPDGSYLEDYDVVESTASGTLTTTFRIATGESAANPVGSGPAPTPLPGTLSSGMLSITHIVLAQAGQTNSFTPAPPVEVLPLPAAGGASWTVDSSDPGGGNPQRWQLSGRIGLLDATGGYIPGSGTARARTCGQLVEGWVAHLSGTVTISPSTSLNVDLTYIIATQYGGLSVSDHVVKNGTSAGAPYAYDGTEVISQVPMPPRSVQ